MILFSVRAYAQYKPADESKRISQEIKQNQQQIKQIEQQIKKDFQQMRQDSLQERYKESQPLPKKIQAQPAGKEKAGILTFFRLSQVKIIIVLLYILLLLFLIKIFEQEIKSSKEIAEEVVGDDVLIQLDKWTFEKKDLTDYLSRLDEVVNKKVIDVYGSNFSSSFIKDTVITEVLFWNAVDLRLGDDPQARALLLDYEDFMRKFDPSLDNISESLSRYNLRIVKEEACYLEYYQDFLKILLLVGSRLPNKAFELYSRYVFVEKFIADLKQQLGDQATPERIQEEVESIVNKFSGQFTVVVRPEKA